MLTLEEILQRVAEGRPLPHQEYEITPRVIDELWKHADDLLQAVFILHRGGAQNQAPTVLSGRLDTFEEQHGWYPMAAVLGMRWALLVDESDLKDLPSIPGSEEQDVKDLLTVFQISGQEQRKVGGRDEGLWTIPFAMLASSDSTTARRFLERLMYAAAMTILKGEG